MLSTPQHPNEQKILDLLWRYYEKTKNYSAAARVLSKLAEKEGLVLPQTRIAYNLKLLARAHPWYYDNNIQ